MLKILKILKNTTSLIKKKPFFTFLILCLFIFLFIYSNFFQVIEGKRGRVKNIIRKLKKDIEENKKLLDIHKQKIVSNFSKSQQNKNLINVNKQKIISLTSKFSENNKPLVNKNIPNIPNIQNIQNIPNIPNFGNLVKPGSLTKLRKED